MARFRIPGELRHERLTTDELRTVQILHDAVGGPSSAEALRAYRQPWEDQVRAALVYAQRRYSTAWERVLWHAASITEPTPIYDALVAERGDPL